MLKKPCVKFPKSATLFFGLKMTPPPQGDIEIVMNVSFIWWQEKQHHCFIKHCKTLNDFQLLQTYRQFVSCDIWASLWKDKICETLPVFGFLIDVDRSSCSRCFIQNTIAKHKERKNTQITPTPPFRPKNYISQLTFRSGLLLMLTIVGEVSLVEMNIFYGFLWPLPASKD